MSLLTKAGRYLASPEQWGIKTEEGKCPQFGMTFLVNSSLDGEEQIEQGQRITGWWTLINTNGGANEITLKTMREALGWDGQSFSSLQGGDWTAMEVQIVVEPEEYKGKTTLKVRYMNPRDYAGGLKSADPQAVQSLDAKYGAVLRALNKSLGGTPKPPTKPSTTPAAEAKKAAWGVFVSMSPSFDRDRQVSVFKALLSDMFEPRTAQDLTANEWKSLMERIRADYDPATGSFSPLSDAQEIDPNDIPF
jgi:hypothetical protein